MDNHWFNAVGAVLSIVLAWVAVRCWGRVTGQAPAPIIDAKVAWKIFISGAAVAAAACILANFHMHERSLTLTFSPFVFAAAWILFRAILGGKQVKLRLGFIATAIVSLLISVVTLTIPMEPNIAGAMLILTAYVVGIGYGLLLV